MHKSHNSFVALIVAAGSGERFGGAIPKQYQSLAGTSVLRRSICAFLNHPAVSGVRVVINMAHRDWYDEAVNGLDLPQPIAGGDSRQESVRLGLESLATEDIPPDFVLIHDGARPLIDALTIGEVCKALHNSDGAIAAKPLVDTLKLGTGESIAQTIPRDNLWQAHTPQGFRLSSILQAHRQAQGGRFTDDAAVAESAGISVQLVHSNPDNMKITNPDDIGRAARLLGQSFDDVRVGFGTDVHRLIEGKGVRLGGVTVPCNYALLGHSDADVVLHSVVDAILGALAEGDIGEHFPPSDPQWKNADSAAFMRYAVRRVNERGGLIAHADVTIIGETPRVSPHRVAIRNSLAELLETTIDRVSVKATTTEKLGFAGRSEGLVAQAVVTIKLGSKMTVMNDQ